MLNFFLKILGGNVVSYRHVHVSAFTNHLRDFLWYDPKKIKLLYYKKYLLFESWFQFFILLFCKSLFRRDVPRYLLLNMRALCNLGANLLVVKERLNKTKVYLEMVKRVQSAQILHANNFPSNVSGKLKVNRHFTALWEWAVLAQKDHVVNVFVLIIGNLVLHFLSFQLYSENKRIRQDTNFDFTYHWTCVRHEFFDLLRLRPLDYVKVTQLFVVLGWKVKWEVIEEEYLLLLLLNFQFFLFLFIV